MPRVTFLKGPGLGNGETVLGRCTRDDTFASIVGRGNVWGIQCHPEKSQEDGLRILRNFAET